MNPLTPFTSFAAFALAAAAPTALPAAESSAPRPNIIFIMVDDMGYGDLGSYGQALIQTPMLDQMADEGMRFTQVYAGSPVCAPARSTLMTGQHARAGKLWDARIGRAGWRRQLARSSPSR